MGDFMIYMKQSYSAVVSLVSVVVMLRILFVAIALTLVQGAIYREIQDVPPGEPLRCKDDHNSFDIGMTWYPSAKCIRRECGGYSNTQVEIVSASCGVAIGIPEHCAVSDLRKPYPDCCRKRKEGCL